jgi:hypothetical protein
VKKRAAKEKRVVWRRVGGVVFECVRAGLWVTPDKRYAIVEQMVGSLEHEWLLFRTNLHELSTDPISPPVDIEDADFWSGWQIGQHFTMGELAWDVATEFLTAEQIERVKRALVGVPRKNAHHRAVIADCRGALKGDGACRSSVAKEWLKLNEPRIPDIFEDLFPPAKGA